MNIPYNRVRSLFIAGIFFFRILDAQTNSFDESWRWVQFTTESGLPSNNVFDVIETPDSTLWAVCDAGVAWYDGFQWQSVPLPFTTLPKSKKLARDYQNDSLLICTDEEWYAVGKRGYRKIFVPPRCEIEYFSGDTILCFRDGLLFFMINCRLFPCEIPGGAVKGRDFFLDRSKEGKIWITTKNGIFRRENNRWRKIFDYRDFPGSQNTITENSAGTVFAHFALPLMMRGLWKFSPGSLKPYRITGGFGDIQAMAVSPSEILVASYYFDEVRIHSGSSWSSSPILKSKCKGLNNIFFRRNGDLVIATNEGIRYYTVSSSRWCVLRYGESEMGAVNEILTTRSGDIWLGTANGIITYGRDGKLKTVTEIGGVPIAAITGLGEDQSGNIWISSGGAFNGAYRWDGSAWKYFKISKNKDGTRFHKIRSDRNGRLWFLGLPRFHNPPEGEEPSVFLYDNQKFIEWGKEHNFRYSRVYAFSEDTQGNFWFGTHGGICKWSNGTLQRWAEPQGLKEARVFTLAIDNQGNVWFGHQLAGFGLGCIDSTGRVVYFTTSDGLVNNFVWEVRVDSLGILWIATRGGLGSYDNGVWSRFDETSGLQSNLLWPVLPLTDKVYVGTHGSGVAILDRSMSFKPDIRIVIDKPNIDRQDVHINWRTYAFWGAISPSEILTQYRIDNNSWSDWSKLHELDLKNVTTGEHTISVKARGLFRDNAHDIQKTTYTILPPLYFRPIVFIPALVLLSGLVILGYIFIARKRRYHNDLLRREAKFRAVTQMTYSAIFIFNEDLSIIFVNRSMEQLTGYSQDELRCMKIIDIISSEHTSIFISLNNDHSNYKTAPRRAEFEIRTKNGTKRWIDLTWGEIMFQEVPALIGTAFDITDRKLAELRIKALASELSATEQRSRKRMAAFLHDKIGHALALSKMKIESLLEAGEKSSVRQSAAEAHALIHEAIQTTRSFTFELSLPILYDLGLVPAIDWLVEEMQKREKIKVTLQKPISKICLADEIRNVLFEGTRELLVNALKHSCAKRIDVSITSMNSIIIIKLQDDGVGFDVNKMEQYQSIGKSFGLYNLKERLKDVGGKLEVESSPDHGTTIKMVAPTMSERTSQ